MIVLFLLGVSPFVHAGWPTKVGKNLAVCRDTGFQDDPMLVSDGAHGAIIAWTDHRAGNEDIYAQRVDRKGKVLWQGDGIAIRNTTEDQQLWDMVSDGSGGAIVIWTHDVGAGGDHLYAQRIDGSGNALWTSGGVVVENVFEVWGARAASDGAGGAYILMWEGWMEGFFWVNRVDANGQLPWANRVGPTVTGKANSGGKITADGAGNAIVAWRAHPSVTVPPDTESDLYAQKVNASGTEVWAAPVAVCVTTSPISSYDLVGDGVGGAFFFFSDARSPTTGEDLYGQRVNSSGVTLWTVNGAVVSAYPDSETHPHPILDSSGGAIVGWNRYTSIGFETQYIQKVGPLGSMVWTAYGIPINPGMYEPNSHDMASDGAGGCISVFGERTGGVGDFDLYVQRYDATGATRWGTKGVKITTPPADPSYPKIISDGVRGAIMAWQDYREDATRSADTYAQRVVKNGTMGPITPCQPNVVGHHPWRTPIAGDPISAGEGVFREAWPLFELGGPVPLDLSLIYAPDLRDKAVATDGRWPFPPQETIQAFTHSAMIRLIEIDDLLAQPPVKYLNVLFGDDLVVLQSDGMGGFDAKGPVPYQVMLDGDTYVILDPISQWSYFFPTRTVDWDWGEATVNRCGEVSELVDRNGNSLSFSYNSDRLPTTIEDSLGRSLTFTYIDDPEPENRHLEQITDGGGRSVSFAYTTLPAIGGSTETVLSAFTNTNAETTQFSYYDSENNDADLLAGIVQPLLNAHIDQTWSAWPGTVPHVYDQWDAFGNVTSLDVGTESPDVSVVTVTHPDLSQMVFRSHEGRFPLEIVDPSGASIFCEYESVGQLNSIVDRLDASVSAGYHAESGKLAGLTNQEGQAISFSYTPQSQTVTNASATATFDFYHLTRVDYPDGSFETATYDAKGNLDTWTDRNQHTWGFVYSAQGFLEQVSNPQDGQWIFTYHADGTMASSTDTDCEITSYAYDPYRRLTRITHADGTYRELTYDQADRVTSLTDELEFTISFEYDVNGNLVTATDPMTQSDTYTFDSMDRLEDVTNRSFGVTSVAYDERGRLANSSMGPMFSCEFFYDAVGHLEQIQDAAFRPWTLSCNAEGLPMSVTSPLGLTSSISRDKTGRITARTNQLGQETTWTRDAMGRITGETNALGQTSQFSFDALGLLISQRLPNGGEVTYVRNSLGLVTSIRDLRDHTWNLSYTAMGRLNQITDPLSREWGLTIDPRGPVAQIAFPDGTTEDRTYDETGRLTLRQFSDGSELYFNRDALGRVEETQWLTLSRNTAGQIDNTADGALGFGATYSPNGLLEAVSYANGAFQVIYGFDERNLLVYVSDDLTQTQIDLTYDDDGRLVFINRSNGVSTTQVYDDANRVREIHHGELVDVILTYDAAGNVSSMDLSGPLDPAEALVSQKTAYSYDSACQLETSPYEYDVRGRAIHSPWGSMTYDIAGRLIAIDGAALGYNGFGDLRTYQQSPTHLRFFYNYALDSQRVVAEMDENTETFRRYYVWTPSGELLYAIDVDQGNAVRHYHFDHLGNTLCITDGSGTITDAYVYHPYGRLLDSSGGGSQAYTFLGKYGVRQLDAAGKWYLTNHRLYDASTGRFASRDPDWPRMDHPLMVNPYHYALCRPTTLIDADGRMPTLPNAQPQLIARWLQALVDYPELGVEPIISSTPPDFHGTATFATNPARTAIFAAASMPKSPAWRAQTAEKGMFNPGMMGSGKPRNNSDHELAGLILGSDFSPVKAVRDQLVILLDDRYVLNRDAPPPADKPPPRIIPEQWEPPPTLIPSRWPTFDGRIHRPMEPDAFRPLIHLGKTESVWKLYRKKSNQVKRKYPNTARTGWVQRQAGPKQAAQ